MTTINQNTVNATKRLIKFLKTSNSGSCAQAVQKLVSDKDHVQLTAIECLPMDDIITANWNDREVAIEKLEALLKTAESQTEGEIRFSRSYNEYRVSVKGSTYYTNDREDAITTGQSMLKEAGELPWRMKPTNATSRMENDW